MDRRAAGLVGRHHALHAFARVQQSEVEQRREHRVVDDRVILREHVLEGAETFQPLRDKVVQPAQGSGAVHGEPEVARAARMIGEMLLDQRDDLARDLVGRFADGHGGLRDGRSRRIACRSGG